MKITKYEHACLLIEELDQQLVIDPGMFAISLPSDLSDVTAVVLTHEHADHLDKERLKGILDANPGLTIFAPSDVLAQLEEFDAKKEIAEPGVSHTAGSFALDFYIRQTVSANINMFYIYQLPVPRLTERDAAFWPIVRRVARLVCTTPEFDALAHTVGLSSHRDGAINDVERAQLRAELDGLVAHLYHLTEQEFAHMLDTFPIVPEAVRVAAQNAYRDVARGLVM